jgi:CDK-activating kinase assembly factor MAT1
LTAFNLINSIDVEETDRRIAAYQRENAEQIDMQSSFEDQQADLVRLRDEEERRQRAERAAAFAQQDAEDRKEREEAELELIRALETSDETATAKEVIKKQRAVALKKSSARHALPPAPNTSDSKPSLLSKYLGFNRSNFSEPEKDAFEPEDPMEDYDTLFYDYRDLFELREESYPYRDASTEAALHDLKKRAGGFDVKMSVWERSVRSAVMGLTIRPMQDTGGDVAMQ